MPAVCLGIVRAGLCATLAIYEMRIHVPTRQDDLTEADTEHLRDSMRGSADTGPGGLRFMYLLPSTPHRLPGGVFCWLCLGSPVL